MKFSIAAICAGAVSANWQGGWSQPSSGYSSGWSQPSSGYSSGWSQPSWGGYSGGWSQPSSGYSGWGSQGEPAWHQSGRYPAVYGGYNHGYGGSQTKHDDLLLSLQI